MYQGSCHCGRIAFEVEGEPAQVYECNCTHCSRKGILWWFMPRTQMHLRTPEESMSSYLFNTHRIDHRFCPNCGCEPFAYGTDPKTGEATVALNVRCLEGLDLAALHRKSFDGLHLL
ncbi:GFA family protein [Dyella solisilvae]|uniref:GFA family protein n=1 Tax=Dyella solisilvae TaxID=1920168 RepID=A0A370K474_9GAMM|nr:GFA family protein [Dyella solisilvae]RDI97461.1 GFA family protein [Dyella solisilvae]